MRNRKFRNGTRKWKRSGHKTKEWFVEQYGTKGISLWEKEGKQK